MTLKQNNNNYMSIWQIFDKVKYKTVALTFYRPMQNRLQLTHKGKIRDSAKVLAEQEGAI